MKKFIPLLLSTLILCSCGDKTDNTVNADINFNSISENMADVFENYEMTSTNADINMGYYRIEQLNKYDNISLSKDTNIIYNERSGSSRIGSKGICTYYIQLDNKIDINNYYDKYKKFKGSCSTKNQFSSENCKYESDNYTLYYWTAEDKDASYPVIQFCQKHENGLLYIHVDIDDFDSVQYTKDIIQAIDSDIDISKIDEVFSSSENVETLHNINDEINKAL